MTKLLGAVFGVIGFTVLLGACGKKDEEKYSEIPFLTNLGINMHSVNLKVDSGNWVWNYEFVDGDGDLGTIFEDTAMRVFLRNEVTNEEYKYPFPYVPPSARSNKAYLKGTGKAVLDIQTFFKVRTDFVDRDRDTFVFTLYIVDEKYNQSNVLTSDSVIVYK